MAQHQVLDIDTPPPLFPSHLGCQLQTPWRLGVRAPLQLHHSKIPSCPSQWHQAWPDAASPVNGPKLLELARHDVMDIVQTPLLPEAIEVEPAGSPVTGQLVKRARSQRDRGGSPLSPATSPAQGLGTSP